MSDLDQAIADIAVLEAVLNDARAAGANENMQKALRRWEGYGVGLWKSRKPVGKYHVRCPSRNGCGDIGRGREGTEGASVAMDWEAPDYNPGHCQLATLELVAKVSFAPNLGRRADPTRTPITDI